MSLIGKITKIKWHLFTGKIGINEWALIEESYNDQSITTLNQNMERDKKYAIIFVDNEKIFIRNFFNSNHPKGFEQKNIYHRDNISGKFMLEDPDNLILKYLKLRYPKTDNIQFTSINYYCVEFELIDNINNCLLNYIVSLENIFETIDNRLNELENENKNKKSFWSKLKLCN